LATVEELIATIDRWDREDTETHFARLERMARTGTDYHARLTKKGLKKYGALANGDDNG